MPDRERKRLLLTLAVFAVLLAVGLAYTPARGARLVADDHVLLAPAAPWRWVSTRGLFTGFHWPDHPHSEVRTAYYRPVTLVTFAVDEALGDTAVEYHFTNVALHVTACALLAVLAMRLGASGIAAVLAALLWGLAPRLTEAVAWISGRADVLAGTLSLAALACAPDVALRPPRRAWIASFASGVLLLLAALAKETAIAAAAAILVAACLPRAGEGRADRVARFARLAPALLVPTVAYAALRIAAKGGVTEQHRDLGLGMRAVTALEAIGRYAVDVVDALRPRWSVGMVGEPAWPYVAIGGLVVAVLLVLVRRIARDAPLAIACTITVVAIAPVLHVVPISIASSVVADRYLYLPLAGLAVALAVTARRLPTRLAWAAGAACVAFALAAAIATRARSGVYADEVTFLVDAAEAAHPHNTAPRSALAGVVLEWGPVPLACALYDRARIIQEASGYGGSARHRRTRENLGVCLAKAGRDDEARAIFEDVLRGNPTSARAYDGLALVDLHAMRFDEAERGADHVLSLDPSLVGLVGRQFVHLPDARRAAPAFATPEGRAADPVGYARMLVDVNRSREASAAWLAIARDPRATPEVRDEALATLAEFGLLDAAIDAASAVGPSVPPRTAAVIRYRTGRWEQIERVRPRIEQLAAH